MAAGSGLGPACEWWCKEDQIITQSMPSFSFGGTRLPPFADEALALTDGYPHGPPVVRLPFRFRHLVGPCPATFQTVAVYTLSLAWNIAHRTPILFTTDTPHHCPSSPLCGMNLSWSSTTLGSPRYSPRCSGRDSPLTKSSVRCLRTGGGSR